MALLKASFGLGGVRFGGPLCLGFWILGEKLTSGRV